MKNKLKKIIGNPKIVLPIVFILALVAGFLVYKYVGRPPQVEINNNPSSNIGNPMNSEGYSNGQEIDLAFPKSGRVNKVNVKVGDVVKKGDTLASLDSKDAEGALQIAKANYQKILNGATGPDIDVAKAAVQTAQVSLDQAKTAQDTLVKNARLNYLNAGLAALAQDSSNVSLPPVISGTYDGPEGQILISEYNSGSGAYFTTSGIIKITGKVDAIVPQPIGDTGLLIKFANVQGQLNWAINIPNKQSAQYLVNYNAYQTAMSTKDQIVANAEAVLSQAQSALTLKQSSARPEDVVAAEGALLSAEGAYNNDFIYAPTDGTITVVNIKAGEIALVNQNVVGMIAK